MIFKKNKKVDLVFRIVLVAFASALAAVGNKYFLLPHQITPGGFGGFATIINKKILPVIPIGVITLLLNIPLYLIALKMIGNTFGLLSITGTLSYSLAIDIMPSFQFTPDPLLACIYGGALMGVGFGIILRLGGSTGGSDMLSFVINRNNPHLSVGTLLLIIDGVVIVTAGIAFGIDAALYALVTIFLCSKVVDYIMDGGKMSKAYYIISNKSDEIALAVLEKLGRGLTGLKGQGMYTKSERNVLLCIVLRSQGQQLKNIVYEVDQNAFIFATNIQEVFGEGFFKLKK